MKKLPIVLNDPWLEPYAGVIYKRNERIRNKIKELGNSLSNFANGYFYYGLHKQDGKWIIREWAPAATSIYLIGSFNNWQEDEAYAFRKMSHGNWELIMDIGSIHHQDLYKLKIRWEGGEGERIPAWANRVVQDQHSLIFNAQVWQPNESFQWTHPQANQSASEAPLVYEAHIGMATEDYKVGTYKEFGEHILPRIKKAGYNTIQLMAIAEHPYYGSFGYHVSNFFAPSSRFGTPEELKELINKAHAMGMRVIMDLIHSHAVRNEVEGLGRYDGTTFQFFHEGQRREHLAWDSLCFNYSKNEVIHFLLSNIKYWIDEYHFDGFRFDGVTSMLYLDHGLNRHFNDYKMYFDEGEDEDAITYLGLANQLCHELNEHSITIAEEVSGYPGLGTSIKDGGLGFDYRMAMGTPDYWIRIIKELPDEQWNVDDMYRELTSKRADEKTVGYAESHDQALVGDKTIIFRLIDQDMYFHMDKSSTNLAIDRGLALHKIIRLITMATSGDAYLNFMGNEYGHPEWIDFPREGNQWSYHYSRRQWSLADNHDLKYHYLGDFDKEMIHIARRYNILRNSWPEKRHSHPTDQILAFERSNLLFIFNFSPNRSYTDYGLSVREGKYKIILSTDNSAFGGQDRIDESIIYRTLFEKQYAPNQMLKIYLPARTAIVMEKMKIKSIY